MPTKKERELITRCNDYLDNLREAFRYLVARSIVREKCSGMHANCSDLLGQFSAAKGIKGDWEVSINRWNIPVIDPTVCGVPGKTELLIQGIILTENLLLQRQCITASVLLEPNRDIQIGDGYDSPFLRQGEWYVVRRFHFDYDIRTDNDDHPRSHLQYGGNFHKDPEHSQIRYELFEKPKAPRIPYPPYDVVLCTDLFLRQFNTPISEIVDDSGWTGIVRKSEKLWVGNYYKELASYIGQTDSVVLHKRQQKYVDWL